MYNGLRRDYPHLVTLMLVIIRTVRKTAGDTRAMPLPRLSGVLMWNIGAHPGGFRLFLWIYKRLTLIL